MLITETVRIMNYAYMDSPYIQGNVLDNCITIRYKSLINPQVLLRFVVINSCISEHVGYWTVKELDTDLKNELFYILCGTALRYQNSSKTETLLSFIELASPADTKCVCLRVPHEFVTDCLLVIRLTDNRSIRQMYIYTRVLPEIILE